MRNFRDLSYLGLKEGMICRSDVLYQLSKEDKKFLKKEHNIRITIDLRRKEERHRLKDSFIFGTRHYALPLAADGEIKMVEHLGMTLPDMFSFYKEIVGKEKKPTWTKIFKLLLKNNNKGILYHCSSGKDRTGVLSAVILYVLGFDKETIYEDYLLTNESPLYYKEHVPETLTDEQKKAFLEYFEARREYLDTSFNEIDRVYGSMDNFLRETCALDEDKINKLRRKYLKQFYFRKVNIDKVPSQN